MDKALEAAVGALRLAITTASNDDMSEAGTDLRRRHVARIDAMQAAIDILAALPATDTSGLVERLRIEAKDYRDAGQDDPYEQEIFDATADLFDEAATALAAKDARLAEAEADNTRLAAENERLHRELLAERLEGRARAALTGGKDASRLTEAQRDLLHAAKPTAYCGYDKEVRAAAQALERAGIGNVTIGDLGPEFTASPAGRAALEKRDE